MVQPMKKDIIILTILISLIGLELAYSQSTNTLWYKQPANFFEESLVLGN